MRACSTLGRRSQRLGTGAHRRGQGQIAVLLVDTQRHVMQGALSRGNEAESDSAGRLNASGLRLFTHAHAHTDVCTHTDVPAHTHLRVHTQD